MKLPFSIAQFLKVFEDYNFAIWPLQLFFYFIALLSILLSIIRLHQSDKIISLVLSFLWMWMGITYHLLFFTAINKAAYIFGIAFLLQGFLFLYFYFIQKCISFRFSSNIYGITGSFFILFALIIYPLAGYFQGHIYPAAPTFGVPCPTTIFTFGLLLWTDKKIPIPLLIIPMIWAAIGSLAAFSLGFKEDIGLLISGLVFIILMFLKNKTFIAARIIHSGARL